MGVRGFCISDEHGVDPGHGENDPKSTEGFME